MELKKLYYIYGLDTSCFYTDEEMALDKKLNKARSYKKKLKRISLGTYAPKFLKRKYKSCKITLEEYKALKQKWCQRYLEREYLRNKIIYKMFEGKNGYSFPETYITKGGRERKADYTFSVNKYINYHKANLIELLSQNLDVVVPRVVRQQRIIDDDGSPKISCRVSVFDSTLTRQLGMKERRFNDQMLIVKVFYFEVANSLLRHGCIMNGEKYVFFSASAGQIRTKKFVMVKESMLNDIWNTLTAGLTVEKINSLGGMNINKYLAYLALCNSGTEVWSDFNIDKTIVVDDFETDVEDVVDYIDNETFAVSRINKELPVAQMDGCGIMLPSVSDKNFMIRLPWVKGLLASFDFRKFIDTNKCSPVIKDIYGCEHNVLDEDIQIIFTKSQFKMWKFFNDWNEYKANFKKFNCVAGIGNEEEDSADDFRDSVINYQMIQSLPDLTDKELKELGKRNAELINEVATTQRGMLKVFGINTCNTNFIPTYFQKCLLLYPALLHDAYCRQTVSELKNKLERDLWSARFMLDGKYTFVIPDLYAFCEWLFMGIGKPNGLLKNGQVSCRLFKVNEEIDCLRSPHLYCEHAIRTNVYNSWFTTNGVYISSHDFISRILQCDFDGDTLLLINNPTLINAAKRNMKDKVSLYYEMKKANAKPVNNDSLWEGLRLAYTGGNIGEISNWITKIWNDPDIISHKDDAERYIKILCMINNFVIDYAKTLYKPTIPHDIKDTLRAYNQKKVPAFFEYAKNKTPDKVEPIGKSPVDRLRKIYKSKRVKVKVADGEKPIEPLNYKMLMDNPCTEYKEEIGAFYQNYVSYKMQFNRVYTKHDSDHDLSNCQAVFDAARDNILKEFNDYSTNYVIDNIIMYLFGSGRNIKNKKAFWQMFGSEVYDNLVENLDTRTAVCKKCGTRFLKASGSAKFCPACRGYTPLSTKTVTCIDCSNEFVVNGKVKKQLRCPDCQKKERQRIHRKSVYRLRHKSQE